MVFILCCDVHVISNILYFFSVTAGVGRWREGGEGGGIYMML